MTTTPNRFQGRLLARFLPLTRSSGRFPTLHRNLPRGGGVPFSESRRVATPVPAPRRRTNRLTAAGPPATRGLFVLSSRLPAKVVFLLDSRHGYVDPMKMIDLERFRATFPGRTDDELVALRSGLYTVAKDWIESHGFAAKEYAQVYTMASFRAELIELQIMDLDGNRIPDEYPRDYQDDDPGAWA